MTRTSSQALARQILDRIRESLGCRPHEWPSDESLDNGTSTVLLELTVFLNPSDVDGCLALNEYGRSCFTAGRYEMQKAIYAAVDALVTNSDLTFAGMRRVLRTIASAGGNE